MTGSSVVQESYSITSGVLDADPFAGGAYPVHLAAAVELRRTSDLFLLGHRCGPCAPWRVHTSTAGLCSVCKLAAAREPGSV